MKVKVKKASKKFEPVEMTVTFESLKELEKMTKTMGSASHGCIFYSELLAEYERAK